MTREWIIWYYTISISQMIFADECKFLSENDISYSKLCFVLITISNVIKPFHTISDVGPFSVNFISLYSFCFLPFLISLWNLHDQLDLFLVFNLDDLFKIPLSNCFHKCCKPAGSSQILFS